MSKLEIAIWSFPLLLVLILFRMPIGLAMLLIGMGGFIGALSRYAVGGLVQNLSRGIAFPHGTIAVNVIGCFLIGGLAYLADTRSLFSAHTRMFLFIGVLGAFTTFSTFALDSLQWLHNGAVMKVAIYVLSSVVGSLLGVWIGYLAARSVLLR